MQSSTKHRLSRESLLAMAGRAFPGVGVGDIRELSEGYFNAAYALTLSDGREVILKVAPQPGARIMSYEKNIMAAEVEAMRLVRAHTEAPVAEVLFYDAACQICPSPYFFMTKLPGDSLNALLEAKADVDVPAVYEQTGRFNRAINSITGDVFGLLGQPELCSPDWYTAFRAMLNLAVQDARALSIDMTIDPEDMLALLERDRPLFQQVTTPRLVHWDLWDGNLFVQDGRLSGIIDLERSMWADVLMEAGFRSHNPDADFLRGYGVAAFTPEERRRILWYDAYAFSQVCLERDYRQYPDSFFYDWSTEGLRKTLAQLQG